LKYREHKKKKMADDRTTYLASPKTEAWVCEAVIPADFFFFSMWSSRFSTTPMKQTWQQAHKATKKASKTLLNKSWWFVQETRPFPNLKWNRRRERLVPASLSKLCKNVGPKPFYWTKPTCVGLDFSSSNFDSFPGWHTEHWWICAL
jgi:hypothetical protein